MRLPQVGDLVRLTDISSGIPYETLLGIVLGYETKGAMAGRAQVVWFSGNGLLRASEKMCFPVSRLQAVE